MGKNPIISVPTLVGAMALVSALAGAGCADNISLPGISLAGFVDKSQPCYQEGGTLYGSGEACGPLDSNVQCFQGGCLSVDTHAQYGTRRGALELDTTIDPAMDCSGNCGPINVTWCGDVTVDGEDYEGRWLCMAVISDDDECTMKAVRWECEEEDEVCDLSGSSPPNYGLCVVPPECEEDSDCEDGGQCTKDSCDSELQCHNDLVVGMECDDGKKCTTSDVCGADGQCAGTVNTCDDGNACTADSCDAATGLCVNTPVSDGTACSDGKACTEGDKCVAGKCAATDKVCDDGNQCTADKCDPDNGKCVYTNVDDTTACDDGDKCTTTDECTGGKCAGTATDCDDDNPCTADSCDAATGECVHDAIADGGSCGDGMLCVAGVCYDEADTCDQAGATDCKTKDGVVGYYTCSMAEGSSVGLWELAEECGDVDKAFCIQGTGCVDTP